MIQLIGRKPAFMKRTLRRAMSHHARHARTQVHFTPLPREELLMNEKPRLQGRNHLPGSTGAGFPEYLAQPRESFPHAVQIIQEGSSLRDLAAKCRTYIDDKLPTLGAILIRNNTMRTADEFSAFVKELGYDAATNEGGSAHREEVDSDASTYTVSNEPPEMNIEMHNEMAYKNKFPRKLLFWCLQEPGDNSGGQTALVRNSELLANIDPHVVSKFDAKGIRYWRFSQDRTRSNFLSWQDVLMTDDRKVAEERLMEQGYNFKWCNSRDLAFWQVLPAFRENPDTKEKVWFNQAHLHNSTYFKASPDFQGLEVPDHLYPFHSYYGDGEEIEHETIQHIRAVTWHCAVGFRWRTGDLLVLDNMAVQHGRISFTGERKLLAYLTNN